MPFFANQNRNQLRQMYVDAWQKHCSRQPLQPVEAQIADVITLHPEYHSLFANVERLLDKDWTPEGGSSNPFLHMGLHLAVRDQIATDRPAGVREAFQTLAGQRSSSHDAEHVIIECLAEALWNAQRNDLPPDETAYLMKIRNRIG
jgi:hypothetical protein